MKVNKLVSLLCMLVFLMSITSICWGTEGNVEGTSGEEGIMPISAELEEDIDPDVTIIGFSIDDGRGLEEVMPQGAAVSCMNEDMHSASTRPCVKSARVNDSGEYVISLDLRNNSSEYDSTTNTYIGLDSDFFAISDDLEGSIQNSTLGEIDGVIELLKSDSNEKLSSFVSGSELGSCEYALSITNTIPKGETSHIEFTLGRGGENSTFSMPVLVVSESGDTLSKSVHTSVINGSIHEEVETSLGSISIFSDNSDDKIEEKDDKVSVVFDSESLASITVKETIKNTSNSVPQYNKIVFNHYVAANSSLSLIDFSKEDIKVTYSGEGKDEDAYYFSEESTDGKIILYTLYSLEPGEEMTISLKGTPIDDWGIIDNYFMGFDVEAEPASMLQGSGKSTAWGKEFSVEDGKLSYNPMSFTPTTKAGASASDDVSISLATAENQSVLDYDEEEKGNTEVNKGSTTVNLPTVIGLIIAVLVVIAVAVFLNKKPKKTESEDKKD